VKVDVFPIIPEEILSVKNIVHCTNTKNSYCRALSVYIHYVDHFSPNVYAISIIRLKFIVL
jgi:hypothetical protein